MWSTNDSLREYFIYNLLVQKSPSVLMHLACLCHNIDMWIGMLVFAYYIISKLLSNKEYSYQKNEI